MNRRFWPVKVTGESECKVWDMDDELVDQIWAEVMVMYKAGEPLYLAGEEILNAEDEQLRAIEADEREGLVREYLSKKLPLNWDKMGLYERRSFLNGSIEHYKGVIDRRFVCNMEIWCECFGNDPGSLKNNDSYKISNIMNRVEKWHKSGSKRLHFYGNQRGYKYLEERELED